MISASPQAPAAESSVRAAVRAEKLSKSYGENRVLKDLTVEIHEGEIFCLLGANGSGKTTLLEIIMGIKKASSGIIEVLGLAPGDSRLKQQRALLMERAFFPYYAKVKEVFLLYSSFYEGRFDRDKMLEDFELDGDYPIRHLSKGQRQRLGIMLTMLGSPRLILLDEPTSGLDPQARVRLWQLLQELMQADRRRTMIFATHDLAEAERWSQRTAIIKDGSLLVAAPPEELRRETIGTRRKLTIADANGQFSQSSHAWRAMGVESVAQLGSELVLYTDTPERIVSQIAAENEGAELRIEKVTLGDAFFRLTGEVGDDTGSFAIAKH